MGLIHCEKHGTQGFSEVCGHIDAEYRQGIYREHNDFCIGEILGILICEECWKKVDVDKFQPYLEMSHDEFLDLDDEKTKPIEDKWSEIYDSVGRQVWCAECVAEIIIKQSKSKGESLPFFVFEKTLNSNQQEKIQELENLLITNFQFQKSKYWKWCFQPNRPSLFVSNGGYTYPLTVKTYYIISENEQNQIIQLAESFLSKIEHNQAKIEFIEKENLIITKNKLGGESCERGEEKLLREVYLNC